MREKMVGSEGVFDNNQGSEEGKPCLHKSSKSYILLNRFLIFFNIGVCSIRYASSFITNVLFIYTFKDFKVISY